MELCWITAAGVRTLTPDEARESAARDDGVLWAHCDHNDIAGMALLTELVPVRAPDLKVCHARSPVPLLRAYPDHFFSAMNGLARGSDRRLHFLPVRIFTRPPIVFTVFGPHHAALSAATTQEDLDAVRVRLRSAQLRPSSAYECGGRSLDQAAQMALYVLPDVDLPDVPMWMTRTLRMSKEDVTIESRCLALLTSSGPHPRGT